MDAVLTDERTPVVRRLDAILAACAPARSAGAEATQAELSGVLLRLLISPGGQTDVDAAAHLSERLAGARWAPHAAAAWLSRTGIEVARPLIARSPVLTDDDLMALVFEGSADHRLEVARRPGLPDAVASALVANGDPLVGVVLLDNATAQIERADIDALIARAAVEPGLRAPLARRTRLACDQAARLAAIVGPSLRRRIEARFPALGPTATAADAAPRSGEHLVTKLVDAEWLRPASLLTLLRRKDVDGFAAALSRLSGVSRGVVEHAMRAPQRRLPALLAAAGVDSAALRDFVDLAIACAPS